MEIACNKLLNVWHEVPCVFQHPVSFTVAGVEIQHCLQPGVVVAFHGSPQHVGPSQEVPLQRSGTQDRACAPSCHVYCTRRTLTAPRPASH